MLAYMRNSYNKHMIHRGRSSLHTGARHAEDRHAEARHAEARHVEARHAEARHAEIALAFLVLLPAATRIPHSILHISPLLKSSLAHTDAA